MNRSWVRFPQAAQIRPPGTGWAFLYVCAVSRCCLWLVAPRVFWAPRGGRAVGPGCFVCPWAAARPRAVRAASFARRVGSKPGQAPPPPTGTAAWPSGPSGALHTSGARSLMCGLARRLEAWPGPAAAHGHRSRILRAPNVVWFVVLGFWGAPLCVVTNVVNRRCFSCGFLSRCYRRRQSDGFFAENSGSWAQIDDVCNRSPHKGLQIAPV